MRYLQLNEEQNQIHYGFINIYLLNNASDIIAIQKHIQARSRPTVNATQHVHAQQNISPCMLPLCNVQACSQPLVQHKSSNKNAAPIVGIG
jgi:hypothetical protein